MSRSSLPPAARLVGGRSSPLFTPTLEADAHVRAPRNRAGAAPTHMHTGYADDILLVAKSAPEATTMLSELRAALQEKGLSMKEKPELWTNCPSQSIRAGTKWLKPQASMTFLVALLTREHGGAVHHRAERAWTKFWAARRHMLTKAVPLRHRLLCLRSEVYRTSHGEPWLGTWRMGAPAQWRMQTAFGERLDAGRGLQLHAGNWGDVGKRHWSRTCGV